ncbi:hypothetical protein LMB68_00160 [Limosilactobacillus reuteri]|uniref:hypothetical protein n=2 Tax=Limosilactobacillus reuteri TaxID=1598 RepID=UPI001E2F7A37|nr:hypothetical protein [Limosilactobacillus reuteri]MCC4412786.1 hypothetical protein [Limosilactobacillus reuteri]
MITTNQLAKFDIDNHKILTSYDIYSVDQNLEEQRFIPRRIFSINIDVENNLDINALTGKKIQKNVYRLYLIAKKSAVNVQEIRATIEKYSQHTFRVSKLDEKAVSSLDKAIILRLFFNMLPFYGIKGTGMLGNLFLTPSKPRLTQKIYLDLTKLVVGDDCSLFLSTSRFTKVKSFMEHGISLFNNMARKSLNNAPWFDIDLKKWQIKQVNKYNKNLNIENCFINAPLYPKDKPRPMLFWSDGKLNQVQSTKFYRLYNLVSVFNSVFSEYFSELKFEKVDTAKQLLGRLSQTEWGNQLDKHIEEFFAKNQLNLIDNRIARDERIEDIKAALVRLLPTVKVNIRPTVEDKFGYNLVVINNKQYFQTHDDIKDNYATDYQQAIVQHLTIDTFRKGALKSTLINSLKELIIKKDLKGRRLSLYHSPDSMKGWEFYQVVKGVYGAKAVYLFKMINGIEFEVRRLDLQESSKFIGSDNTDLQYLIKTPANTFYNLNRKNIFTLPNAELFNDLNEMISHQNRSSVTKEELKWALNDLSKNHPNYRTKYQDLISIINKRELNLFSINDLKDEFDFMKKNKILSPIAINLLLDELYEQYGLVLKVKPKIKDHVQKYLSGLTDINYFFDKDDQDVIYYNVGTISKNMNMSIAKASHIWQLQPNIKLNERGFATIETENILNFLQLMMVNFV